MAVNRVPVLKRCRALGLELLTWAMTRSLTEPLQEQAKRYLSTDFS